MSTWCRPAVLCRTKGRGEMTLMDTEQGRKREASRLTGGNRGGELDNGTQEVQAGSWSSRIVELELENLRLTRLVGDLLLKNQRLRESN